jgi:hypothetical protein
MVQLVRRGCAVSGGSFYNPPAVLFPASYVGKYFFADLCGGWIRILDPADNSASAFATGISSPVDLKVGLDGSLYYLARGSSAVFRVTVTDPPPPRIMFEGATDRGITFDSVTMTRDPFALTDNFNFSSDRRTRLMLFAVNADLLSGETSSAVTAQAEDSAHTIRPATVSFVGKVPGYYWLTEIVVRLPDGLAANQDVLLTITLHGKTSNQARVKIQ